MAFTGSPVVEQITDRCVRVTGVSLAASAAGILGLFGSTVVGAVALPEGFKPEAETYQGNAISQIDKVRVTVNPIGNAQAATAVPLRIVKSGANLTFAITITNDDGAAATSNDLEFYVFFD